MDLLKQYLNINVYMSDITKGLNTKALGQNWGGIFVIGIILLILGVIALGSLAFTTLVSVLLFGWLLFIGGVVQIVQAFRSRSENQFFIYILSGILSTTVGFIIITNPTASAFALTLVLAIFFMVAGIFRIIGSLSIRFPNWGWSFFYGVVTFLLGILIWRQFPATAVWVIGLFIGIELILNGLSWMAIALASRNP